MIQFSVALMVVGLLAAMWFLLQALRYDAMADAWSDMGAAMRSAPRGRADIAYRRAVDAGEEHLDRLLIFGEHEEELRREIGDLRNAYVKAKRAREGAS